MTSSPLAPVRAGVLVAAGATVTIPVSCVEQGRWAYRSRHFAAGERIHTENSYKYSPEGFSALLTSAGFSDIRMWTDPRGWFALFFARRAE